jgi:hypothetical protein
MVRTRRRRSTRREKKEEKEEKQKNKKTILTTKISQKAPGTISEDGPRQFQKAGPDNVWVPCASGGQWQTTVVGTGRRRLRSGRPRRRCAPPSVSGPRGARWARRGYRRRRRGWRDRLDWRCGFQVLERIPNNNNNNNKWGKNQRK